MTIQEVFAQNVRKYRKQKGYSQEEFARVCGVHRTYMGLIERAKTTISIEILEKICKELGVSYDEILKK
jgi:transcriptional regulator with XRE-family HTH domain